MIKTKIKKLKICFRFMEVDFLINASEGKMKVYFHFNRVTH